MISLQYGLIHHLPSPLVPAARPAGWRYHIYRRRRARSTTIALAAVYQPRKGRVPTARSSDDEPDREGGREGEGDTNILGETSYVDWAKTAGSSGGIGISMWEECCRLQPRREDRGYPSKFVLVPVLVLQDGDGDGGEAEPEVINLLGGDNVVEIRSPPAAARTARDSSEAAAAAGTNSQVGNAVYMWVLVFFLQRLFGSSVGGSCCYTAATTPVAVTAVLLRERIQQRCRPGSLQSCFKSSCTAAAVSCLMIANA